MSRFRYVAWMMLVSLLFPAACTSSRDRVLRDPVARSGASSEEIWYREGGARVAYTAVARPRHLYTGDGATPDPALYEQAPALPKTPPKRRPATKPRVEAPKKPDCSQCPPAEATQKAPPTASPPAEPASAAPVAGDAVPPFPSTMLPQNTGGLPAMPAGSPPRLPLPGMPPATPAPVAPNASGR